MGAGKLDESIAEYEKVLSLNSKHPLALCNLGAALAQQGKLDQAITQYRLSLQADDARVDTHYNLALAFQGKGQADEALAEYRKVLDLYPNDQQAYWSSCFVATAMEGKGQKAEAMDLLKKAAQLNDRVRVDLQDSARTELRRLQQPPSNQP